MFTKLVSVIIPTYNRADLVVRAIESVKIQNYPAVQIIVVDDGSKDQTAEKVAKIENVEYYYQENKGQAAARNLGLKYVRGEYFVSLDSDDVWDADFLETAVAALERFEADFVFLNWREDFTTGYQTSGWERNPLSRKFSENPEAEWTVVGPEAAREIFIKTCPAPSSAILIRRAALKTSWNEEMRIADDWCLMLDIVIGRQCRAAYTLKPFWTKQIRTDNIYHGRETLEIIRDFEIHDCQLIAERFEKQLTGSEKAILRKRLAINYLDFGRLSWRNDGFERKQLRSISHGLGLAPFACCSYMVELAGYRLKNLTQKIRSKPKKSSET